MAQGYSICRGYLVALTLLLALLLCACRGSSTPSLPPSGPGDGDGGGQPAPTSFDLSGTVRDASGTLLAGVQVLVGLDPSNTGADGSFLYENLKPGTYTISLQDQRGNFLCRTATLASGNKDFAFELPADGPVFQALSVSPRLNASSAALDAALRINLSETIDSATVSRDDFSIQPELGALNVVGAGQEIIIDPVLQLPQNQLVLVEYTGEIESTAGETLAKPLRWRFRTTAVDTTPPDLTGTTPAQGTGTQPANQPVRFEFSENLSTDAASLLATIQPDSAYELVVSGNTVSIMRDGGWVEGSPYTVTLQGVADTAGNLNPEVFSISFTASAMQSSGQNRQAEWHQALDLVVFTSNRNGSYDIYTVNPDGTGLNRITSLPGNEYHPTLSANGELLAFQARGEQNNWDIFVMDFEPGADAQAITPPEFSDTEPYFSRTISRQILFASDRSGRRGLYLMHYDGSNPVEQDLSFSGTETNPQLHPQLDTQMLFTSNQGGDTDIWRRTVSIIDGTSVNQNLTQDLLSDEHSPAWFADANTVLFISNWDDVDNLWLADATGEFPQQVTYFTEDATDPAPTPFVGDSRCILSLDDGMGGSELAMIDTTSGEVLNWLTGPEVQH